MPTKIKSGNFNYIKSIVLGGVELLVLRYLVINHLNDNVTNSGVTSIELSHGIVNENLASTLTK